MNSGSDRRRQEQLLQQQNEDRRLFLEAYERANQPDPLEERRRASSLAFLDDIEGKNGPFDVTKVRGMEPYLNLYESAKTAEAADANTDTGALQLGASGASPNLIARMRETNNERRKERAGGQLADAFAGKYAEVTGNTVPFLMRYQQGQNEMNMNATGGRSTASTGIWANFRPAPSIWSQMFQQFARGAGQGVSMMAGG